MNNIPKDADILAIAVGKGIDIYDIDDNQIPVNNLNQLSINISLFNKR